MLSQYLLHEQYSSKVIAFYNAPHKHLHGEHHKANREKNDAKISQNKIFYTTHINQFLRVLNHQLPFKSTCVILQTTTLSSLQARRKSQLKQQQLDIHKSTFSCIHIPKI